MINFIDTSNWQGAYSVGSTGLDAFIVKATEGLDYVDPCCDNQVQQCIAENKLWGFYHFGLANDAVAEADYFVDNTVNYFGHGIPVLDWEYDQSADWVNAFVERVHERTGVWPWIYANPWRFNQGGVNQNCMRWVASYPNVASPSFDYAQSLDCPEADGLVGAWQFCSDGSIPGIDGNVDCDIFYGDENAWRAYAGCCDDGVGDDSASVVPAQPDVLENDKYRITVEVK